MIINTCRSLVLLAAGLIWAGLAQAQVSVNTSGGDATGAGGIVAYSVGQVVYTSNSGSTGTVDQGVQQAYEIFTVGVNEIALHISLKVFPNPTMDLLTLQLNDYKNESLIYQLYGLEGKLMWTGQIVAQQTQIDMSSLPTATYFVKIVNRENKLIQIFKIVKN